MKITIINYTDNPDRAVYMAARHCYAEGDIPEPSPERIASFVKGLIASGHTSTLEHVTFSFDIEGISRVVSHELVRHRIASYCVAGDTMIPSYVTKSRYSAKSRTIEKIYEWYKSNHPAFKSLIVRCIDEVTHKIVPAKIEKVFFNGEKDVYAVKTESGRELKCTMQHRLFTEDGWKQLSELAVGNCIYSNGLPLLENEDWLRHNYLTLNRTRKSLAGEIGCCESIVNRAFRKYGIKKPHSQYPNRRGYKGHRPSPSAKTRQLLALSKIGVLNHSYKPDRSLLSLSGGYYEAKRLYSKAGKTCEFCGSSDSLEVHHVDKNPRNNKPENIKFLCTKCHHLWHRPNAIGAFKDRIISIEYVGKVKVYDMQMAGENHSYVANGIVVHNCQQSQRYVEAKAEPEFWLPDSIVDIDGATKVYAEALKASMDGYRKLIAMGVPKQDARYVLPNGMPTRIVATFNARSLLNFFELRCCRRAQPEMREMACEMLRLVKKIAPAIFEKAGARCWYGQCREEKKCGEVIK